MKKIFLFFIVIVTLVSCDETQKPKQSDANNSSDSIKSNEKKVNIRAVSSDRYLTCDTDQDLNIFGDKDTTEEAETFILVDLGGDKVALRAYNGKYVCADQNKKCVLSADRNEAHEWETFTMEKLPDNKVAFKASNKKYVCCDRNLRFKLIANRDSRGEWETFTIIYK